MGRVFHVSIPVMWKQPRETFIPAAPGSSMPEDRQGDARLMVQANICHDGQNDDIAEKKHRYK